MDFPLEVCLAGVAARIGQKREDMPWIEAEFDEGVQEDIIAFPGKSVHKYIICLKNIRETKDFCF